ncbi:Ssu1 protein [Saccharomycopsis crataegensis]|uniref:Ssu1 protein n=1 Tax=Saccharomycopsis crataegensis TaxID=43959 RepID=A0AAV5QKF9_9ASCO|nr:Ssu1 protein [Saccharomycopsis crataegensis]
MSRTQLILKRVVQDFHPIWFASTMGTGISSTILYNFPYPAYWLKVCSYIMFAVCCLLFIFFNLILVVAAFKYPQKWKHMLLNVGQSVFFGCYSMGFSSILSYLHNIVGEDWATALFVLWIINIAISLFTAWIITFLVHYKGEVQPHEIHISFLLPVVSQNVVAAVGGVLYDILHPNLKLPNIIISYLCWANGIALTGWVVGVYIWKLYVHRIPLAKNTGFVAFLPVGAFGQGAFAVMIICDNFRNYLQDIDPKFLQIGLDDASIVNNNLIVGQSLKYLGLMVGLFLVSNGYFFTFNAVASVWGAGVDRFTKGFWACTFPLGTMALANHELYTLFGFRAFRVVSAVYSTVLVLITTFCIFGSLVYEFPHEIYRPIKQEDEKDALA